MTDTQVFADPAADFATISQHLSRTRPWVRFLSILGFVWSGFMIVMGLVIGAVSTMVGNVGGVVFLIVYPVMGVLYIFPCLFLGRYASNITQFESSRQRADLESALDAQRSFWKFVGIMALVGLVLALVAIPLAIVAGIAGAMLANQG